MRLERRSSLRIQREVIFALFLREMKSRFGQYRLGILWAVLEPILFVSMMMAVRGAIRGGGLTGHGDVNGLPYVVFFMMGYMFYSLFNRITMQTSNAIKANKQLFGYRQVRPLDAVFARVMLEVFIWLCVMSVLTLGLTWFGYDMVLDNYLMLFFVAICMLTLGLGAGLTICVVKELSDELGKVLDMAMRPLFFISGVFFSLEQLPQTVWPYLLWNPLLHGTELARDYATASFESQAASFSYLFFCSIAILFLGLALYRLEWRRLIAS